LAGDHSTINAPKYMSTFMCVGAACEETCCSSFQVDVDRATFRAYMAVKEPGLGQDLQRHVKKLREPRSADRYARIHLTPAGNCPFLDQNKLFDNAKKLGEFWEASSVDDGLNQLGAKNAFRDIADSAVQVAQSGDTGLMGRISRTNRMSHKVVQAVEGINNRLSNGMSFLATVGAVSPFIGLFGTVYGIVNALIAIGISGQASIDKVAGPVGEALYMTAIGLFVAVPAVIFYNLLGRRNKTLQDTARHFAVDVEQLLISSTTKA
jgi:biopolymer transport protein ExbB